MFIFRPGHCFHLCLPPSDLRQIKKLTEWRSTITKNSKRKTINKSYYSNVHNTVRQWKVNTIGDRLIRFSTENILWKKYDKLNWNQLFIFKSACTSIENKRINCRPKKSFHTRFYIKKNTNRNPSRIDARLLFHSGMICSCIFLAAKPPDLPVAFPLFRCATAIFTAGFPCSRRIERLGRIIGLFIRPFYCFGRGKGALTIRFANSLPKHGLGRLRDVLA